MSLGVFHGEGWGLSVQALVIMMALLGTLPLGHGPMGAGAGAGVGVWFEANPRSVKRSDRLDLFHTVFGCLGAGYCGG